MNKRAEYTLDTARHIRNIKPSYIREILYAASAPGMISLAGGLPATESFPMTLLGDAMQTVARDSAVFQYGQTAGYQPLIDFLTRQYNLPAHHDLLVCNGSQQALDLIARAYLEPGDELVMETPGYLGALQIFRIAQASIVPVEQGAEGPDLGQLEAAFRNGKVKLFYAVPDFHNPSGVCWSGSTRKAVASLCQQYAVTLIEDSPYRDIRFSGDVLPMVSSFCPDHAFVMRSFSKTVAPGMRIGVVSAPAKMIEPLNRIKQAADLHSNLPLQAALLHVLGAEGFPSHGQRVRELYGRKYHALAKALKDNLGDRCQFDEVEGGMFVWLKLVNGDALEVAARAIQNNLAVVPGDVFYPDDRAPYPALRLNFSHTPIEKFDEAIRRLERAL